MSPAPRKGQKPATGDSDDFVSQGLIGEPRRVLPVSSCQHRRRTRNRCDRRAEGGERGALSQRRPRERGDPYAVSPVL